MRATSSDVVVIGAGAMGSAAAWWLARRGVDTVLVEQFEQGHLRGSSHGATRIFRMAYDDRRYVRMAVEALPLWRELEADAGESLLTLTGGVDHGDQTAVGVAAALAAEAVPHEVISAGDAAERWPGMRFDGRVLVQPDAGRCLADATVCALQDRAAHHGADVRFDAGPATVRVEGPAGVRVTAGDQQWSARVAVVTAGAWAPTVAAGHAALPLLRVTREQVQHFAPVSTPAAAGRQNQWPSFIHHRDRTVYGLLSPAEGVKVAFHHAGAVVDPATRTFDPDPTASADASAYAETWLPGVEPTPLHVATCLYTSTADQHFVLERHGPIVVGSPCSGHGFKFTPLIGRRLADLATDPRFSTQ